MGRASGFIACYATLASQQVNFCLVPEVPFALEGPSGFLEALGRRILLRKHAVVVVAEGAGQNFLITDSSATDASGNKRLGDIGIFLRDKIIQFFESRNIPITLKYIDPSYAIRSGLLPLRITFIVQFWHRMRFMPGWLERQTC